MVVKGEGCHQGSRQDCMLEKFDFGVIPFIYWTCLINFIFLFQIFPPPPMTKSFSSLKFTNLITKNISYHLFSVITVFFPVSSVILLKRFAYLSNSLTLRWQ